jgi:hypothetical protein
MGAAGNRDGVVEEARQGFKPLAGFGAMVIVLVWAEHAGVASGASRAN